MSSFDEQVYTLVKQVPAGKVTTYKALAQAIGTKAYQAVGQALKRNPRAPIVPCHRVVSSDGSVGGFRGSSRSSTVNQKIQLLQQEGVRVVKGKVQGFEELLLTQFTIV